MKNKAKLISSSLGLFVFAVSSLIFWSEVYAQPRYRLETRTLGHFYEDRLNQKRFPFSNYLIFDIEEPDYGLRSYTDGRFYTDLANDGNQFDLYQASIQFDRYEAVQVEAGRFPILNSFDYISLDGVKLNGTIREKFQWDVFGGWTRDTILDEDRNPGKLAGAGFSLTNDLGLRNRLQFLIEDYDSGAEDQRVGLSLGRDIFLKNRVALDGGVQLSLQGKSISQGFLSGDSFLSENLAINLMYYYEDPRTDQSIERDQIYALFASSGVHGIRPTLSYYFLDFFQVSPYVEWTFYEVKNGDRENAYQIALPLFMVATNKWKLGGYSRYTYINSPGGTLHFFSIGLERPLWKRLLGRIGGELVLYDKINQDSATATRGYFEAAYPLTRNIELTSNLETNSNEDLEKELRFMFYLKSTWQGEF